MSSTEVFAVKIAGRDIFFPGDFVMENPIDFRDYGIIESIDHVERTAHVQWFKRSRENPTYVLKKIKRTE